MSEDEIRRELRRLTADVEDLRGRMALLEEVFRQRQDPEAMPPDSGARLTLRDKTFSAVFTRLAAVCFALLGALVLRVATQQGWVSSLLGTSLGLFYCLLLLFALRGGYLLASVVTVGLSFVATSLSFKRREGP